MPIQTNYEKKTTSKYLGRNLISESLQKDVILENSAWHASGGNNIYSLSKLAVILGAVILQL